jgi:hypothetical protein
MNVPVAGTSIALGAGSVIAGAGGAAALPAFILAAPYGSLASVMQTATYLGVPAKSYVIASIILGSLSVILAAVNLVRGIQMRERLIPLSKRIFRVDEVKALVDQHVKAKAGGGSVADVATP